MKYYSVKDLESMPTGSCVVDGNNRVWTHESLPPTLLRMAGAWWVSGDIICNSYILDRDYGPIPILEPDQIDEFTVDDQVVAKKFYVDPKTGGKKEVKLAQLGAIDPSSLIELAKVAGHGAEKYETYNYLKGYLWSLNFNSAQRHILAFWGGENLDPESNLPHLAHAAWHCLALLSFVNHDLGTDDRWVPPTKKVDEE